MVELPEQGYVLLGLKQELPVVHRSHPQSDVVLLRASCGLCDTYGDSVDPDSKVGGFERDSLYHHLNHTGRNRHKRRLWIRVGALVACQNRDRWAAH